MTAKELFRELSHMESIIEAKKQRVQLLTELAASPGSPNYSGMPKNPSPEPSRMASIICKKIDLEREIQEDVHRLQEKKLYTLTLIGEIDNPDYQGVLVKRYFEHLSWDEVSSWLHISKSWLYKLNVQALEKLDKLIENAKEDS